MTTTKTTTADVQWGRDNKSLVQNVSMDNPLSQQPAESELAVHRRDVTSSTLTAADGELGDGDDGGEERDDDNEDVLMTTAMGEGSGDQDEAQQVETLNTPDIESEIEGEETVVMENANEQGNRYDISHMRARRAGEVLSLVKRLLGARVRCEAHDGDEGEVTVVADSRGQKGCEQGENEDETGTVHMTDVGGAEGMEVTAVTSELTAEGSAVDSGPNGGAGRETDAGTRADSRAEERNGRRGRRSVVRRKVRRAWRRVKTAVGRVVARG